MAMAIVAPAFAKNAVVGPRVQQGFAYVKHLSTLLTHVRTMENSESKEATSTPRGRMAKYCNCCNFSCCCPKHRRQFFASAIVSLGLFGLGWSLAWSATALPSLDKDADFSGLKIGQKSWIASLVLFGIVISAPLWGISLDRVGRKPTLIFSALLQIFGAVCIFFSRELYMLYIGRFLSGLGVGAAGMAVPVYISEIAESDVRGLLGTMSQIFFCLGIVLSYAVGTFFPWNFTALFGVIPMIIVLLFVYCIPESPRFNILRDQTIQAHKTVSYFRQGRTEEDVDREVVMTMVHMEVRKEEAARLTRFAWVKWRSVVFCCFMMILHQLTGIIAVLTYSVDVFSKIGATYSHFSSIFLAILVTGVVTVVTLVVDRIGRRCILITAGLVVAASAFCFAIAYFLEHNSNFLSDTNLLDWVQIISISSYFAAGFATIPVLWLIASEILETRHIGMGLVLVTLSNQVAGFVVVFMHPILVGILGSMLYFLFIFYGCIALVGVAFATFVLTETTHKTLDEIHSGGAGATANEEPDNNTNDEKA